MPLTFPEKASYLRYFVLLVPFLLYLNTLQNKYALDDAIVLTENEYVQEGFRGLDDIFLTETFTGFFREKKELVEGGRYRPLSLATFAIGYQLWGQKPGLSHLFNALFFSVLCLILFELIRLLCVRFGINKQPNQIAFFATLLFACHPVHTEVVANIKGRDELLSVLFLILSLYLALKYLDKAGIPALLASGISLFAGLLSKENAIFLWPLLVLVLLLDKRKISPGRSGILLLYLGIATLSYLLLRSAAVGGFSTAVSDELMNNPYLHARDGQKLATVLYTLLLYLKLLLIPHPLTYDYYPYHITLHNPTDPTVLMSGILYVLILIFGVRMIRKQPLVAFCMFLYLITLLPMTNLFINIGSFMNERFLFLPSVGFCIAAGYGISLAINSNPRISKMIQAMFILVLLIFSVLAFSRNRVWKDNLTLFTHDVQTSQGSAKGNCAAGGILYEKSLTLDNEQAKIKMLNQSIRYLNTAIRIYPDYIDALLLLGNARFELSGDIEQAGSYYFRIFSLAPDYKPAQTNYLKMLGRSSSARQRVNGYRKLLSLDPDNYEALYQLGSIYGKMLHRMDSAIYFLEKAVNLQPNNKTALRDLGVAYAMQGEFTASLPLFIKVLEMDPDDKANYINLGITYQKIGETERARHLFEKAETIQK